MDFHKGEQTRCDLFFVWIVTKTCSDLYLRYKTYTITRNSSRVRLTIRSLESDSDACVYPNERVSSSWRLCLHTWNKVRHLRARQSYRFSPFRIASKGPKRADHAAGTDFTRPRYGSCQLSLIEILKCNASLAAAADRNDPRDPGEFRRRQTGDEDNRDPFWSCLESLACDHKHHLVRVNIVSFQRHILDCAIKISIIPLDVCTVQNRKRSGLLECALLTRSEIN